MAHVNIECQKKNTLYLKSENSCMQTMSSLIDHVL